ncbi:hypothetical protein [Deinococcus sp.]|uniref:hypothetical protein n=1 Tax=Deinococcus sp. TaxID=47478 RepID=UPI002869861B|nr:hypothetical protein [Deinococcus sp.]
MTRFGYLLASGTTELKKGRKQKKKARRAKKKAAKAHARDSGSAEVISRPDPTAPPSTEHVSSVYVRQETVRAVWREVKRDGGESVSELVEDLLLEWLRKRTR